MDRKRSLAVWSYRSVAAGVVVLGIATWVAALPASAAAATVSFSSPSEEVRPTLVYQAAPGEKNRLTIGLSGPSYDLRQRRAADGREWLHGRGL